MCYGALNESKESYNLDELFNLQADFCTNFGNAIRLKILFLLSGGEKSVGSIAEKLGVSMSNISQHLRLMKDRRIITSRKDGQRIFYRITNEKFIQGPSIVRSGIIEIYGLDREKIKQALSSLS
ncbi:MAG: metalloregulator ArsR/SmtB family transcription factor [Candidatus Glassbacteria bacterium]